VALVAGLIAIGADLGGAREQLQEWGLVRAFPREGRDETLIVIASFHHSEGIPDTEAHWEICRAIREAKEDLGYSKLRVEVEPTRLRAGDRDGAERLGRRYNASMIIWGADTGVRVTVNYLNLKDPEFEAAEVEISETEETYVVNPSAYAEYVTYNLPGQLTFLSLFAIGHSHYREGAYAESVEAIEKAIASVPFETEPAEGLASAYFYLGWLHHVPMDDDEAAIAAYTRAIELDPEDATAFNNRGNAYYDSGDYARAIADYDRAIDIDPQHEKAYYNRGNAYRDKGDYDVAIADYTQAIDIDPQYEKAYNNRGIAYSDKGDYDAAIADYTQAIDIDPQHEKAYYNRGNAYRDKGNYDTAIGDYNKAIEIDPQYEEAYVNRGIAYKNKGDYDTAIADYTQAIDIDPQDEVAYYSRGNAYRHKGDYDTAIGDYNKAIEIDGYYADAYWGRGLAHRELGNAEAALADFRRYLELQPDAEDRETVEEWIAELEAEVSEP
jgi:tetratricopeptide (TPR) repeat protein